MKTKNAKAKKATLPLERTCRGFVYGKFVDRYGQECSIQKSSLMADDLDGECIWFGVNNNDGNFKILPHSSNNPNEGQARFGFGWQEKSLRKMYPGCDVSVPDRMHLTRKMVKDLLPILRHFAETGELPEPKE